MKKLIPTLFIDLSVIALFCATPIINLTADAKPNPSKSCDGVHEFHGNPLADSGRGSDLRILFFVGERENILGCFKNTRGVKVAPLHKELDDKMYSKKDKQLILEIVKELNIKDPYLANGGI